MYQLIVMEDAGHYMLYTFFYYNQLPLSSELLCDSSTIASLERLQECITIMWVWQLLNKVPLVILFYYSLSHPSISLRHHVQCKIHQWTYPCKFCILHH